jgi:hypothetical protein
MTFSVLPTIGLCWHYTKMCYSIKLEPRNTNWEEALDLIIKVACYVKIKIFLI